MRRDPRGMGWNSRFEIRVDEFIDEDEEGGGVEAKPVKQGKGNVAGVRRWRNG